MEYYFFINSLKKENREIFYKALAENRALAEDEWEEITKDILKFRDKADSAKEIGTLLKYLKESEAERLKKCLKATGTYERYMNKRIYSFEEIQNVDEIIVTKALKAFSLSDIVKACIGTSPANREYIQSLLQNTEIEAMIVGHRSISIAEITKCQEQIMDEINRI